MIYFNTSRGYVKLWRSFEQWEWRKNPITVRVFLHCIMNAAHVATSFRGVTIERGQTVFTAVELAEYLGFTRQKLRTALANLERTGELDIESGSKYMIVTVNNYDDYQDETTQKSNHKPNHNYNHKPNHGSNQNGNHKYDDDITTTDSASTTEVSTHRADGDIFDNHIEECGATSNSTNETTTKQPAGQPQSNQPSYYMRREEGKKGRNSARAREGEPVQTDLLGEGTFEKSTPDGKVVPLDTAKKKNTKLDRKEYIASKNLPDPIRDIVIEWCEYKAERKEKFVDRGFKMFVTQVQNAVDKHGQDAVINQITASMSNGYQGAGLDRIGQGGYNRPNNNSVGIGQPKGAKHDYDIQF